MGNRILRAIAVFTLLLLLAAEAQEARLTRPCHIHPKWKIIALLLQHPVCSAQA